MHCLRKLFCCLRSFTFLSYIASRQQDEVGVWRTVSAVCAYVLLLLLLLL